MCRSTVICGRAIRSTLNEFTSPRPRVDNVPACTKVGEFGCVIAFSTYNDVPGPNAEFSRLDTGYWIYPEDRSKRLCVLSWCNHRFGAKSTVSLPTC